MGDFVGPSVGASVGGLASLGGLGPSWGPMVASLGASLGGLETHIST